MKLFTGLRRILTGNGSSSTASTTQSDVDIKSPDDNGFNRKSVRSLTNHEAGVVSTQTTKKMASKNSRSKNHDLSSKKLSSEHSHANSVRPAAVDKELESSKFPFTYRGRDELSFRRNQLVHVNSRIAILIAHPSDCDVTVKSRMRPMDDDDVEDYLNAEDASGKFASGTTDSESEFVGREDLGVNTLLTVTEKGNAEAVTVALVHKEKEDNDDQEEDDESIAAENADYLVSEDVGRPVPENVGQPMADDPNPSPKKDNDISDANSSIILKNQDLDNYFHWRWDQLNREELDEERRSEAFSSDKMTLNTQSQTSSSDKRSSDKRTTDIQAHTAVTALRMCNEARRSNNSDWHNRFLQLVGPRLISFTRTDTFLNLTAEDLCSRLSDDNLSVTHERDVFRAATRWLRHDLQFRLTDAPRVLATVRYGLMAMPDLVKCAHRCRQLRLLDDHDVRNVFLDGFMWRTAVDEGLGNFFADLEPPRRISKNQLWQPFRN